MLFNLAVLASLTAASVVAKTSYENHSVVRCNAANREQLDKLHALEEKNDFELDFWLEARRLNSPVDIMVSSTHRPALNKLLTDHGIKCSVMIEDVDQMIAESNKKVESSNYFDDYHNSEEVHAFMDGLAAEFPKLATTSVIGQTYGGKNMQLITISTEPNSGKPALWFDGGLHAREWVSVATVTYLADALVRGYDANATAAVRMLDNFDVLIAPILNVDGYDYTWAEDGDRMWRKTRSPNDKSPCVGTDPNRNWAFHWGEAGTSAQACSDSYEGIYNNINTVLCFHRW